LPRTSAAVFAPLLLLVGTAAGAQPSPYELRTLAPGVYAAVREVPPGGASDSNALIIVNEHDVVVVDAQIFPSSARQMVEEIRKLTPNPVRYVINTHWHSDHHYGNYVYRQAFPGVELIQHPSTRSLVLNDDIPSLKNNLDTVYPTLIEGHRTTLETGRRSGGEPLTDEQRPRVAAALGLYEFFLADMAATPVVPGTLTVADSLVLHRGERTIEVKHLGRGNTSGDLIVHLPKERIVATGDLVVHPIPFAFFACVSEWPETLRALRGLDAATIVPGHGEIQTDWSYVDRLIELLESTWDQARAAVAAGKDPEATLEAVDLDSFREAFGGEDKRAGFDRLFRQPAVAAAFALLHPELAAEAQVGSPHPCTP
jgi:cyclase